MNIVARQKKKIYLNTYRCSIICTNESCPSSQSDGNLVLTMQWDMINCSTRSFGLKNELHTCIERDKKL